MLSSTTSPGMADSVERNALIPAGTFQTTSSTGKSKDMPPMTCTSTESESFAQASKLSVPKEISNPWSSAVQISKDHPSSCPPAPVCESTSFKVHSPKMDSPEKSAKEPAGRITCPSVGGHSTETDPVSLKEKSKS